MGKQAVITEASLQLAEDLSPDIILLDINGSVNGFEATRKILKKNPLIKIIGLSIYAKQPSYIKYSAIGCPRLY